MLVALPAVMVDEHIGAAVGEWLEVLGKAHKRLEKLRLAATPGGAAWLGLGLSGVRVIRDQGLGLGL